MSELINIVTIGICFLFFSAGLFLVFWRYPKSDKILRGVKYSIVCFGLLLIFWSIAYLFSWFYQPALSKNIILNSSFSLSRFALISIAVKHVTIALLRLQYPIVRKVVRAILLWGVFSLVLIVNALFLPEDYQWPVLILCLIALIFYIAIGVSQILKTYDLVIVESGNFFSFDISQFLKWGKITTHALSILGITAAINCFFEYNLGILYFFLICIYFSIMIFSLIKYVILIGTYINDIPFAQKDEVEKPINNENLAEVLSKPIYRLLEQSINTWVKQNGFTRSDLTIVNLSVELSTNRTYLSTFIREKYGLTFREWISHLRLEYSKQLLLEQPSLPANKIGLMVGYSPNRYIVVFTEAYGISPSKWRSQNFTTPLQESNKEK